ncbi:MAG: xanthine dehydrogenase family protein molybdopterin-binding subunit [Planctomycetota bacterium]
MSTKTTAQHTRRQFLKGIAASGMVLGLSFGSPLRALALAADGELPAEFQPNAFLRIGSDGVVTIYAKHDEMGQGIHTGLAIAICEELEIDVDQVTVLSAPAGVAYANSAYRVQVTGGSTSTWSSFDQMRSAGAVAREMLIAAAAKRWGVDRAACVAKNGTVQRVGSATRLTYGELAADAAKGVVPTEVPLKDRGDFTRIGKPTPRVDSPDKVRGIAKFSLDQRAPGMLTAMVARCPYFGGKLHSCDDSAALRISGVKKIVRVPSGVAVIAVDYWTAYKAREALQIKWKAGRGGALDSERLREHYVAKSKTKGMVARADGDVDAALAAAEKRIEATYEVPFQAHAPMEPLSCMVTLQDDGGAHIVTGSQMLGADHPAAAARLGVPMDKVKFTNSYLGGGFGRRANHQSDFVLEALEVALAAKSLQAPIKTVWAREDDLRGGWYRPMYVNAITAGIDDGKIVAWRHRVVGQSIAKGTPFEPLIIQNGIDGLSVEGAADMPHGIPNLQVELHTVSLPVSVLWWRSVGHSNTAFAKESFLDECAAAAGRDPYQLRRELLAGHPRWLRVLDLAAKKAGWGSPLADGVGRGISVHESFKGFAAHVIEASVENGQPRIHRIVCAIDCGLVVNPDQVESQLQSAAVFALSATLGSEITFTDGLVDQSNFHDFQIVRMHECPEIEVHIVESNDAMGGIGEVGVPGIASATCSAIHAATGKRIRKLPIGDQLA